jgi:RNA-directed DNA polymerase
MSDELAAYLRGWIGYFGRCQTPSVLQAVEEWTRRRLRSAIWSSGNEDGRALPSFVSGAWDLTWPHKRPVVRTDHGDLGKSPALAFALPNAYFDSLGIPRLTVCGR